MWQIKTELGREKWSPLGHEWTKSTARQYFKEPSFTECHAPTQYHTPPTSVRPTQRPWTPVNDVEHDISPNFALLISVNWCTLHRPLLSNSCLQQSRSQPVKPVHYCAKFTNVFRQSPRLPIWSDFLSRIGLCELSFLLLVSKVTSLPNFKFLPLSCFG